MKCPALYVSSSAARTLTFNSELSQRLIHWKLAPNCKILDKDSMLTFFNTYLISISVCQVNELINKNEYLKKKVPAWSGGPIHGCIVEVQASNDPLDYRNQHNPTEINLLITQFPEGFWMLILYPHISNQVDLHSSDICKDTQKKSLIKVLMKTPVPS